MSKYFQVIHEFLTKAIKCELSNEHDDLIKLAKDKAEYQQSLYSGLNQDDYVNQYKVKESDPQKTQRNRLHNTRTKHVVKQAENYINLLENM